ncbi:MAG: SIS domain-containing protein [Acidobacteriota bacterium]
MKTDTGPTRVSQALAARRSAWEEAGRELARVEALGADCIGCLQAGGQVVFCGNGGSAAMSEHLAAELVGRYEVSDRPPLAARALSANSATVTALGNDLGQATVFARQIEAVCRTGDIVVALSTSGTSENIVAALAMARQRGCIAGLFTGDAAPPGLSSAVTHLVRAPARRTSVIQELHLFYGHLLCELIEAAFTSR